MAFIPAFQWVASSSTRKLAYAQSNKVSSSSASEWSSGNCLQKIAIIQFTKSTGIVIRNLMLFVIDVFIHLTSNDPAQVRPGPSILGPEVKIERPVKFYLQLLFSIPLQMIVLKITNLHRELMNYRLRC